MPFAGLLLYKRRSSFTGWLIHLVSQSWCLTKREKGQFVATPTHGATKKKQRKGEMQHRARGEIKAKFIWSEWQAPRNTLLQRLLELQKPIEQRASSEIRCFLGIMTTDALEADDMKAGFAANELFSSLAVLIIFSRN